jgi:Domain of unknown function (DUF5063)
MFGQTPGANGGSMGMVPKLWSGVRRSKAVARFVEAVARYCGMIERLSGSRRAWAVRTLRAVTELEAAACALPPVAMEPEGPFPRRLDDSERIFNRLLGWLGPRGGYFVTLNGDEVRVSGCPADDLRDIYCDLRPGLERWRGGPSEADAIIVWEWTATYQNWLYRDVQGATRALLAMSVGREIGDL